MKTLPPFDVKNPLTYRNSPFVSNAVKTACRGLTPEVLREKLIKVGVPAEVAEEFLDDPNAVPTSIRELVLKLSD